MTDQQVIIVTIGFPFLFMIIIAIVQLTIEIASNGLADGKRKYLLWIRDEEKNVVYRKEHKNNKNIKKKLKKGKNIEEIVPMLNWRNAEGYSRFGYEMSFCAFAIMIGAIVGGIETGFNLAIMVVGQFAFILAILFLLIYNAKIGAHIKFGKFLLSISPIMLGFISLYNVTIFFVY